MVPALLISAAAVALAPAARADAVTDWNEYSVAATKGWNGTSGIGVALDTNVSSRIDAIEARAVFDAINSVEHFSKGSYYYDGSHTGSASGAAAQAAHDVLLAQLPNPTLDPSANPGWTETRNWLDARLAESLKALGVAASDGGIAAGKAAALAASNARLLDNASPATTYGAQLVPTSNPGVGVWRQSNAGPGVINPATGAPTGFDAAGVMLPRPGAALNWRDLLPFSLTQRQIAALVADVPLSPRVGSVQYRLELEYVRKHGQDSAPARLRSADQTAQALYYKQDGEIFVNEVARIASKARHSTLLENAALFALLDNAIADTRHAAFASKYEQKFWRPITALNADADGAVRNDYASWRPLAATPAHPSNTSGHSATGAAGAEVLRVYFGSDRIVPDGSAVVLGSLPWLVGVNQGTGNVTTRSVSTLSEMQLENGASRLYLGVHYGTDNYQGQVLGLAVADAILHSDDPAASGLKPLRVSYPGSPENLEATLARDPETYGYFGRARKRD